MYRKFMLDENYNFIKEALQANASLVEKKFCENSFWACYGSYVINQQRETSDIDVLHVHSKRTPANRVQGYYKGVPITIYSLSRFALLSDGIKKLYGGYFSGKLLNPFVLYSSNAEDYQLALATAGGFISDFAAWVSGSKKGEICTAENITADSVLARLHVCPWYASYFVRYFALDNFPALWQHMIEVIPQAMVASGKVVKVADSYMYVDEPVNMHSQMIQSVARFWSLGSCLHKCMPNFPDYYIQKANKFLAQSEIKHLVPHMNSFLQKAATRKEVSNDSIVAP